MPLLGIVLLIVGLVPVVVGYAVIWFPKCWLRLALALASILLPLAGLLFCLSPLPQTSGLTHESGYDDQSPMPLLFVLCEVWLAGATAGMIAGGIARRFKPRAVPPAVEVFD